MKRHKGARLMKRRGTVIVMTLGALAIASSAFAAPYTTLQKTIQDTDGDNLLEYAPGEDYEVFGADEDFRPPKDGSILNFLQLSDFQMVDEESPARVEFLDTTQRLPGLDPFSAAYRPQESLTTQVTEAMVRQARNTVSPITQEQLELTILTGDNADSQQFNESRWFIDILDGTAGRRDAGALPEEHELPPGYEPPEDFALAEKIDPNSGVPIPGCEATPGSVYDGVKGGGKTGYYNPDFSDSPATEDPVRGDGDGYSPHREENEQETGRDVTVRDFPGLFENANQPFEALGLDMPWFSAFGNHDALIQGNSTDAYVGPGSHYGAPVPPDTEVWNPQYQTIAMGCFKPNPPASTLLDEDDDTAEEITARLQAFFDDFVSNPQEFVDDDQAFVVPPDARRCFLAKDEPGIGTQGPCQSGGWIEQHFLTTGAPAGHGFAPADCALPPGIPGDPQEIADFIAGLPEEALCASEGRPPLADFFNDGYYSFVPRPGLRFVVLDTVTDDCGTLFCSEGSVDNAQFRWLEAQIDAAAAAPTPEYVLVFSHHTLRTTRWPSTDVTEHPMHYGQAVDPRNELNPQNPSGEKTLAQLYCEHPNVIGHIAGHEHENYVQHYRCDGSTDSGLATGPSAAVGGFWHVSTAAHIDWPQQSRMIELVDNGDGTTSLVLTMLDHDGPAYPGGPRPPQDSSGHAGEQVLRLASIGRELAYNDYQGDRGARGGPQDRNVIVVLDRPFPAEPGND